MTHSDPAPYVESFDRITRDITGADQALALLRQTYISEPELIDGARDLERRFRAALEGLNWHWPWYDEWLQRFGEMGTLPRMWDGREGGKPFLLCHTVNFSRRRDNKWGLVRFSPPLTDEPQPIQELIASKISAYATGSVPIEFPPFFPGDRTHAQPYLQTRTHRSPQGFTICAFRGFE